MRNLTILLLFLSVNLFSQSPFSGKVYYDNNGNQVFDIGDSIPATGQIIVNAVYPNTTQDSLYKKTAICNGFFNGYVSDLYFFALYLNSADFYNYAYTDPVYSYITGAGTTRFKFALQKWVYPAFPFKGRIYYDNNYYARYDASELPIQQHCSRNNSQGEG